jgi:hypothetical protein
MSRLRGMIPAAPAGMGEDGVIRGASTLFAVVNRTMRPSIGVGRSGELRSSELATSVSAHPKDVGGSCAFESGSAIIPKG